MPSMDVIYFIQPIKEKYNSKHYLFHFSLHPSLYIHYISSLACKLTLFLFWIAALSCFYLTCREENLYIESTQKYVIPVMPSHLYSVNYLISMVFLVCSLCCRAFIYFSYPAPKDLVSRLKSDMSVLPRIGALREVRSSYYSSYFNPYFIFYFFWNMIQSLISLQMNLEYFPIESQVHAILSFLYRVNTFCLWLNVLLCGHDSVIIIVMRKIKNNC